MIRDQLKLNDDKTEFLLIGTKHQLEKVNFSSITVGDALIEAKPEVRNQKLNRFCQHQCQVHDVSA